MFSFKMYIVSLRYAWSCLLDGLCYVCDRRKGKIGHVYNMTLWAIRTPEGRKWLDYGNYIHDHVHKF